MSISEDCTDLERQIARDLAIDTRSRATEAATHLRMAMDLCCDLQGSAALSRASHHMDEAATALLEVLR